MNKIILSTNTSRRSNNLSLQEIEDIVLWNYSYCISVRESLEIMDRLDLYEHCKSVVKKIYGEDNNGTHKQ